MSLEIHHLEGTDSICANRLIVILTQDGRHIRESPLICDFPLKIQPAHSGC